jgi:hypothetical protein
MSRNIPGYDLSFRDRINYKMRNREKEKPISNFDNDNRIPGRNHGYYKDRGVRSLKFTKLI